MPIFLLSEVILTIKALIYEYKIIGSKKDFEAIRQINKVVEIKIMESEFDKKLV